jgi:hypothetical protein
MKMQNYLRENNILILGYYIKNIFFYKKDFNIKKIDKKNLINNLKKLILKFFLYRIYFINNLKMKIFKLLILLKKKYGNY